MGFRWSPTGWPPAWDRLGSPGSRTVVLLPPRCNSTRNTPCRLRRARSIRSGAGRSPHPRRGSPVRSRSILRGAPRISRRSRRSHRPATGCRAPLRARAATPTVRSRPTTGALATARQGRPKTRPAPTRPRAPTRSRSRSPTTREPPAPRRPTTSPWDRPTSRRSQALRSTVPRGASPAISVAQAATQTARLARTAGRSETAARQRFRILRAPMRPLAATLSR